MPVLTFRRSGTWYDEHMKRVFQLVNFYLVATALLVTAYANSINGSTTASPLPWRSLD